MLDDAVAAGLPVFFPKGPLLSAGGETNVIPMAADFPIPTKPAAK